MNIIIHKYMNTLSNPKVDYNSGYGFHTHIWGPIQWSMLHLISFNYPVQPTEDDKVNYMNYIQSLTHVLPCKACRDNLVKNLSAMRFGKHNLKDRATFSRFIYDLHNHVNQMLGKPKYLTYEQVRDKFELFRAKCINDTPTIPIHKTGCIQPLNNIKSQSIIHIVPLKENQESLIIDRRCLPSPIVVSTPKIQHKSQKSKNNKKSSKRSKKSKKKSKK